ncbi:Tetratricopeptide repeat protein [compost metagenome]
MEQGNHRRAYEYFSMAAEKEPLWPEALFCRAQMAYYKADKWGAAENAVKALRLEPALERLFDKEGLNLEFVVSQLNSFASRRIEGGNYTAARAYLDSALELKPDYDMALLTMAELYVAAKNGEEAVFWLQKAVEINPELRGQIDTYACYKPLRSDPAYQALITQEPLRGKSFYYLEMIAEPGCGGKSGSRPVCIGSAS